VRRRAAARLGIPAWALLTIPVVVALPILVATEADVGIALPPVLGDPGVLVRWGLPGVPPRWH